MEPKPSDKSPVRNMEDDFRKRLAEEENIYARLGDIIYCNGTAFALASELNPDNPAHAALLAAPPYSADDLIRIGRAP